MVRLVTMKRFALLLLLARSLAAQTPIPIQNASFETFAPFIGNGFNTGPIPSWNSTSPAGTNAYGSWQAPSYEYTSIPDGKVIAFSNGATLTQDTGVTPQQGTTYTLSVWVGHRADGFITNYTVGLAAGTSVLCSKTDSTGKIPAGTFQQVTVSCPVTASQTGTLVVQLGASVGQAGFDNVSLTSAPTAQPCPPPSNLTFTVNATLTWDDSTPTAPDPVTGQVVSSQADCNGNVTSSQTDIIQSNGSVTISKAVNIQPQFITLNFMLLDAAGHQAPGGVISQTVPSAMLSVVPSGTYAVSIVLVKGSNPVVVKSLSLAP